MSIGIEICSCGESSEDKASALYIQQKIRGFLHLYNGQAILAGCRQAIDPSKDKMITAYRNRTCIQLQWALSQNM